MINYNSLPEALKTNADDQDVVYLGEGVAVFVFVVHPLGQGLLQQLFLFCRGVVVDGGEQAFEGAG